KNLIERVLVHRGAEAADNIDLSVQRRDTGVRRASWHWSQIAPALRRRVEFLKHRRVLDARRLAARDIDFSVEGIGKNLGPRGGHSSRDRPRPLGIRPEGRTGDESEDREERRVSQDNAQNTPHGRLREFRRPQASTLGCRTLSAKEEPQGWEFAKKPAEVSRRL